MRNILAVYALRRAMSAVWAEAASSRSVTSTWPARSTTTTEVWKPFDWHSASAASAIVFARPSDRVFCMTMLCAAAADARSAATLTTQTTFDHRTIDPPSVSRCRADDLINRALVHQFLQARLVDARYPAEHKTRVPGMLGSPSGHLDQVLQGARANGGEHFGIPTAREDLHEVDDLVAVGPLAGRQQRDESVNPDALRQVFLGLEQDVESPRRVVSHGAVDVETCLNQGINLCDRGPC